MNKKLEWNRRTPAPEGAAVAWGCFDANGLDDKLVYRDRWRAEDAAFAFTPSLTVKPLYASPVVPKTADEMIATAIAWLNSDDPTSWGDFEKRLNAVVSDEAAPVVPVGVSVDALAQEIRRVDGHHTLGAGALAEALLPFIEALRPTDTGANHD
jgi:hypothetical protein